MVISSCDQQRTQSPQSNTMSNNQGGKRTGAGRKPRKTPRTALTLKVEPDVAEAFKSQCKANGNSQVEQFTAMVSSSSGNELDNG